MFVINPQSPFCCISPPVALYHHTTRCDNKCMWLLVPPAIEITLIFIEWGLRDDRNGHPIFFPISSQLTTHPTPLHHLLQVYACTKDEVIQEISPGSRSQNPPHPQPHHHNAGGYQGYPRGGGGYNQRYPPQVRHVFGVELGYLSMLRPEPFIHFYSFLATTALTTKCHSQPLH